MKGLDVEVDEGEPGDGCDSGRHGKFEETIISDAGEILETDGAQSHGEGEERFVVKVRRMKVRENEILEGGEHPKESDDGRIFHAADTIAMEC
jgi:hypothetical protein